MGTPGLFMVVVIGLLVGAAGRLLLLGRPSRFAALIAGVAGAVAAPPLASALGYPLTAWWQLPAAALAGAVTLLGAGALMGGQCRSRSGRSPKPDRRE